jgi:hypothetical protein
MSCDHESCKREKEWKKMPKGLKNNAKLPKGTWKTPKI